MLGTLQTVPPSALTAGRALHEWVEGVGGGEHPGEQTLENFSRGEYRCPRGMEGAGPDGCGVEGWGLSHCDSGKLCGQGSRGRASPAFIC